MKRACLLLLLVPTSLLAEDTPRLRYGEARQIATLANEEINESSGLACGGPKNPGIFWTHNDSGDRARFFAFDREGAHRGVWNLSGVKARDWEDMVAYTEGETRWLLLADTGDNNRKHEHLLLHFVREPTVGAEPRESRIPPERTLKLRYPDGAHDMESVAVAPQEGVVYLVVKDRGEGTLVLKFPLHPEGDEVVAEPIGKLDLPMTTAMDMSPDERRVTILTYTNAYEWARGAEESWAQAFERAPQEIVLPFLIQREGLCYGPDGRTLYVTSEKLPTPLIEIPVLEEGEPQESEPEDERYH